MMETSLSESAVVDVRRITDLETLRMLADPLRLSILAAFPGGENADPLTVKELAERLGENQTKLYRHIKQLEEANLIYVAQTRVVSGIIEKRYRPTYRKLTIESDVFNLAQDSEDFSDATMAMLESARDRLRADLRSGRVPLDPPTYGPDLSLQISSVRVSMTPERYVRVRTAITELIEREAYSDEGPGVLPVVVHALLYPTLDERPPAS
ncbi:helix-turn-helix domain-containing protein [Streptosporangium sp. NPDC051022]|uniref:ArsR/SmtB family transcription factor n=1 Tax=Streptosporangium sp. NPDC051022 TaxID=3155752 RepID=UPI0034411C44